MPTIQISALIEVADFVAEHCTSFDFLWWQPFNSGLIVFVDKNRCQILNGLCKTNGPMKIHSEAVIFFCRQQKSFTYTADFIVSRKVLQNNKRFLTLPVNGNKMLYIAHWSFQLIEKK